MTSSKDRLLFLLVGVQALTFIVIVLMFVSRPANEPGQEMSGSISPSTDNRTQQRTKSTAANTLQLTDELETALREIIRDELSALSITSVSDSNTNKSSPVVSYADLSENERQQQENAVTLSTLIIQQAASSGVWTKEDTEALLPHLGKISNEQRLALANELHAAINRQELDIEDFPPL